MSLLRASCHSPLLHELLHLLVGEGGVVDAEVGDLGAGEVVVAIEWRTTYPVELWGLGEDVVELWEG